MTKTHIPVLAGELFQAAGNVHVTLRRAILRPHDDVGAFIPVTIAIASAFPIATPLTAAPVTPAPATKH